MKTFDWEIRLCENPDCGLRFPIEEGHPDGQRCPLCLGATMKVLAYSAVEESQRQLRFSHPILVSGLLDNIRSTWNVGSIFRTSEGLGASHLYLTGITPTPDTANLSKTALGAESSVAWSYHRNAVTLAERLSQEGHSLWALETNSRAKPLSHIEQYLASTVHSKEIILVMGNERAGVDPGLLDQCHETFFIPMHGRKNSYNVSVAYGIALGLIRIFGGTESNK
jgi:tRNA G18 (ribose-2'-O)-methylase SpoU